MIQWPGCYRNEYCIVNSSAFNNEVIAIVVCDSATRLSKSINLLDQAALQIQIAEKLESWIIFLQKEHIDLLREKFYGQNYKLITLQKNLSRSMIRMSRKKLNHIKIYSKCRIMQQNTIVRRQCPVSTKVQDALKELKGSGDSSRSMVIMWHVVICPLDMTIVWIVTKIR